MEFFFSFSFVFDSLSVVVVLCSYAPRIVLSLSPSHRSLVPVLRVNYSIPLSSAVIQIGLYNLLPSMLCSRGALCVVSPLESEFDLGR